MGNASSTMPPSLSVLAGGCVRTSPLATDAAKGACARAASCEPPEGGVPFQNLQKHIKNKLPSNVLFIFTFFIKIIQHAKANSQDGTSPAGTSKF